MCLSWSRCVAKYKVVSGVLGNLREALYIIMSWDIHLAKDFEDKGFASRFGEISKDMD